MDLNPEDSSVKNNYAAFLCSQGTIDKAYKIVLKTNKKINDQDYKLSFYGDELKLVENVDTQIHAYSQIKELEV
jgi:hypothetical protein